MTDDAVPTIQFGADARLMEAQLNRAANTLNRALNVMEARATAGEARIAAALDGAKIERSLSRFNGEGFGKALEKTLDSSRLAVFEAGASRVRLFGSAMESLGPLGLTAAAGIIAVGAAVEGAMKAADWAEELVKTSKALALSTTTLQEYDFVASATGIANDKMRESLSGVSKTIASVETGLTALKKGPSVKLFEAILGDADPAKAAEALRQLGGVEQVLPKILDYASKLSDTQRIGVAKALKMDPEVLNSLVDGRDKLSGLIAEAHHYGLIVDDDVIRRSAEAAEQMHVTSTVIDDELRVAFLGLTGDAATASNALLGVVDHINDIIAGARNALGPIQAMLADIARIPAGLPHAADEHQDAIGKGATDFINKYGKFAPLAFGPVGAVIGAPMMLGDVADNGHRLNLAGRGGDSLGAAGGIRRRTPMGETIGGDLFDAPLAPADPGHGHPGGADPGPREIGAAQERYLEALARATTDLDAAHAVRVQLIDQRQADAIARANTQKGLQPAERAQLVDTARLTHAADLRAENEAFQRAQDEHQRSIEETNNKIDDIVNDVARSMREAADKEDDNKIAILRAQDDGLQAELGMAKTRQMRQRIQDQIADNERQISVLELQKDVGDGKVSPEEVGARQDAIDATYGAKLARAGQDDASPFAKFAQPGESVGDQVQGQAVSAMEALNSGLAEAISHGKSLKDTLKSALQTFEQGILKVLLEDAEKFAVRSVLSVFGFADGGPVPGAGGPRSDSIPARLSPGEYVVNAAAASRHRTMLDAINSGHVPGYADGGLVGRVSSTGRIAPRAGGTVHLSVVNNYDMHGLATDAELDRRLAASAAQTKASTLDVVQRSMPGWSAQYQNEYGR